MNEELLKDWARLNKEVMDMGEAEIAQLLEIEKQTRARLRVMLRLYHRLSRLRGAREKAELAQVARG